MNATTEPKPEATAANVVQLSIAPKPRKEPRAAEQRFKIKEFANASGNTTSYRVDGYKRDGTRVRENFAELLKAQTRQLELETEFLRGEARTEIQATKLTRDQIAACEVAVNRLGVDHWQEIGQAVESWLREGRQNAVAESPRLDDAFKQFETWLDKVCELRDLSRKNLKRRVNVFVNSTSNLRVADVRPETIDAYLAKRDKLSAKSKDNDRRAISRFFSWCMGSEGSTDGKRRKWTATNPCQREKQHRPANDSKPAILTLKECEVLLRKAEQFERGRLLPYTAVCLLAGLRPFEAARLTWDAVNLTDGEIRLEAQQTKTGKPRVVSICPTLKAWLQAHKNKPFFPSNWRRDFDVIKETAGLVKRETAKSADTYTKKKKGKLVQARRYWKKLTPINWVPDIMRHTAISHYFRKTGSYGQTAEQFGNSEAIIKNHYASRVSSKETKAFYAILPKKGGRK